MPRPANSPPRGKRRMVNSKPQHVQPTKPAKTAVPIKSLRSSSSIGASTARSLEEQLDLWVELAKTLEGKLEHQQKENERLKQKVTKSNNINQELQEEVQFKTTRIQDLEQQCSQRTSKLSQLAQIITAKKSNKLESELIDKSTKVEELLESQKALKRRCDELTSELKDANLAMSNMRKDREKNNRLLLELSDIVRTLNRIAIDYEKDKDGCDDSTASSSTGSTTDPRLQAQDQSLRNVKRKIEAINSDRQKLVEERTELKQTNQVLQEEMVFVKEERDQYRQQVEWSQMEIDAMKSKIYAFETSYQEMNRSRSSDHSSSTSSSSKDDTMDHSQKEKSTEEERINKQRRRRRQHRHPWSTTSKSHALKSSSRSPRDGQTTRLSYSVSDRSDDGGGGSNGNVPDNQKTQIEGNDHVDDTTTATDSESVPSRHSAISTSSSFSTIDPPPSKHPKSSKKDKKMVPLKDYEALNKIHIEVADKHERLVSNQKQLKTDFDKALDVIERLRMELSKRKAAVQTLESSKADADDLQRNMNETLDEIKQLKSENKGLNRDMNEARRAYDDVSHNYKTLKRQSDSRIEELINLHDHLQQQYFDLEAEYTAKIESLDQKLVEANEAKIQAIEDERTAEQERRNKLSLEHEKVMEIQQNNYEELKLEYDTFLEVHLKTEDELRAIEKQYEDSLTKISHLEAELVDIKAERTAEASKFEADLGASQRATEDVLRKLKKLQAEYDISVNEHEKTKIDAAALEHETRRKYESSIANHKRLKDDAIQNYNELRKEYDHVMTDYANKEKALSEKYKSTQEELERVKNQHQKAVTKLQQMNKQSTEEIVDGLKKQWQERIDVSKEQLESVKSKSAREIEDLRQKQADTLHKLKKFEFSESRFKELQKSYGAALLKIESLMREATVKRPITIPRGRSVAPRPGRVLERIKHFEQKNSKTVTTENPDANENSESNFSRDFAAILQRVGSDESSEISEASSMQSKDETTTIRARSTFTSSTKKEVAVDKSSQKMTVSRSSSTQTDFSDPSVKQVKSNSASLDSNDNDSTDIHFFAVVRHASSLFNVNTSLLGHPKFDMKERLRHQESDPLDELPPHRTRGAPEKSVVMNIARRFDSHTKNGHLKKINQNQKNPASYKEASTAIEKSIFAAGIAQDEAERLRRVRLQNKIRLDTTSIQSQARTKDFRRLELQYKTLREQYDDAVQNDITSASCSGQSELTQNRNLEEELTKAETKLHETKKDLHAWKSDLDTAREEQEKEDTNLRTAIQEMHGSDSWSDIMPPPGSDDVHSKRNIQETVSIDGSEDEAPIVGGGDQKICKLSPDDAHIENRSVLKSSASLEDETSTIADKSNSKQGTDELHHKDRYMTASDSHVVLSDHNRITSIQNELRRAKVAAEMAREKQRDREKNLVDVIYQYKSLKKQHDELAEMMKSATEKNRLHAQNQYVLQEEKKEEILFDMPTDVSVVSEVTMIRLHNELEEGRRRMMVMEKELERAQSSAQKAREAQTTQQKNLREVLADYNALQDEFMTVLGEKQELEKALRVNKDGEDQSDAGAHHPSSLSSRVETGGVRVSPVREKAIERTTKFYHESIVQPLQEAQCSADVANCAADIWQVLQMAGDDEDGNGDISHHKASESSQPTNKPQGARDHRGDPRSPPSTSEVRSGAFRTRIEIFGSDDSNSDRTLPSSGSASSSKKKLSSSYLGGAKGILKRGKGLIGGVKK